MSNNYKEILDLAGEEPRPLNVGHGNCVISQRVVAILGAGSLPVKRLRERAATENLVIDATAGRKTKSIIVTDSRHLVLSSLSPQTLFERLNHPQSESTAQLEWKHGEFAS